MGEFCQGSFRLLDLGLEEGDLVNTGRGEDGGTEVSRGGQSGSEVGFA